MVNVLEFPENVEKLKTRAAPLISWLSPYVTILDWGALGAVALLLAYGLDLHHRVRQLWSHGSDSGNHPGDSQTRTFSRFHIPDSPPLSASGLVPADLNDFRPIHEVIAHAARETSEVQGKEFYPLARIAVRQAAIDGSLRLRGKRQISEPHSLLTFSSVHTDIPSSYWANSTINVLAAEAENAALYHTSPEAVWSWGKEGIYAKNYYAAIKADWTQVMALWPLHKLLGSSPTETPRDQRLSRRKDIQLLAEQNRSAEIEIKRREVPPKIEICFEKRAPYMVSDVRGGSVCLDRFPGFLSGASAGWYRRDPLAA
ncbi:MAG: hypothetical protein AABZ02_08710 [Bacteroidota bacterium]